MEEALPPDLADLRSRAEALAFEKLAPLAEVVDRESRWPRHAFDALAEAGLMGLLAPASAGGLGQGMQGLVVVTEALGRRCPSSAICFGMHCVGTAVIAAKATPQQAERFLRPIAAGEHVTTLALSEKGSGSHFYLPETRFRRQGNGFAIAGGKAFVTNGGHADSYVVTAVAEGGFETGEFSCLLVDRDRPGMRWTSGWNGLGMRGNSSRGLALEDVEVPEDSLLGNEGDQIWYVFEVVAPYFLMAMAGTYLGTARAALDIALQHLRSRRHSHSGETLAHSPVIQHRVAELWFQLRQARQMIHDAARRGDLGDPGALPAILGAKVVAAEAAVNITNEAMTLCGGIAYQENSTLARLLRDARASHVMSPTTDILKQWAGRSLLGLPLL